MSKIGRNDPCPCGSGRKYKKCCGLPKPVVNSEAKISPEALKLMKSRLDTQEKQRIQQQGKGKPIISAQMNGIRFVAVGNQLLYSRKWKTFHDFLFAYLGMTLGRKLGDAELRKPLPERHPIAEWYHHVCMYQQKIIKRRGEVTTAQATGTVSAYIELAYNLYLLAHNETVQKRLLKRLLNKDQFHGAYYETYVAAVLILAGCDLEFEDEADGSQSHCEFTATFRATGNSYSVEAKSRTPGKPAANIGRQLYNALSKEADWPRVVFIDVNVPDASSNFREKSKWMNEAMKTLRDMETDLQIDGKPAPPAYIFLSNHPYLYSAHSVDFGYAVIGEGFKIPDFKDDATFPSIRAVLHSKEAHADMFALLGAIRTHGSIPTTFDGEIPAFAFGTQTEPRLLIGQKYNLPGEDGQQVVGELIDATVSDSGIVHGIYRTEEKGNVLCTCPLTDEEFAAFKKYPDTFFGVERPHSKKIDDPVELFGWFYDCHKNSSKEILLTWLKNAPDYATLATLDQKELAMIYCERLVASIQRR